MVMLSNHLQDVSDDELAIIRKFGERYRRTHNSIMTIGELLAGPPRPTGGPTGEDRRREAIDKLMDRGWLVTNSTLCWDQRSDCILLGEGLNIARRLAGDGDIRDQFAWRRAPARI
jgi:hypothetical protein